MAHPIIFNGSLGLGLMLVGLGLNATLRPNDHLQRLEFPIPTEPLAKKFSLALMKIWGIRNITVGALISIIWTTGNENLMAKALSAAIAMPITDGFIGAVARFPDHPTRVFQSLHGGSSADGSVSSDAILVQYNYSPYLLCEFAAG
ncbi:hypothetical protein FNAPI_12869 [Fusarium napiforme]|uniref:Uncharacterized protein n=1 Tax=Fusarium napiforme TaxID=42672 RepID=A0A8H5IBC3_9HYPO|nr:hypothetical protein FNAPI_12869 [Fusarium napiforme]